MTVRLGTRGSRLALAQTQSVADVLAAHPKIKAVIPIHLFGGCADLDPLCEMAAGRGIAPSEASTGMASRAQTETRRTARVRV